MTPANPADPARAIGQRAKALFESREFLCSEAILAALAEAFGGELTPERAKALASPFPEGLGKAGCLCGAVSGGALGLGVYLPAAVPRRQVREAARGLHDAFKAANKATCCRVLCKRVEQGSAEHFAQCAGFTGQAGEMAARIILDKRPELARGVDAGALTKKSSGLASFLRRVADWIG
jgi:C_GCAxxG_C_C family probable redox protein